MNLVLVVGDSVWSRGAVGEVGFWIVFLRVELQFEVPIGSGRFRYSVFDIRHLTFFFLTFRIV